MGNAKWLVLAKSKSEGGVFIDPQEILAVEESMHDSIVYTQGGAFTVKDNAHEIMEFILEQRVSL